jgi:predicted  nucleic acid-binding Zn-ribbon protein
MKTTLIAASLILFMVVLPRDPAGAETSVDTNKTATIESARADMNDQLETLKQTVQKLEERLNRISEGLGEDFERNTTFTTMEKRLKDLERQMEQLERDLEDMDRKIRRIEANR